MGVSKPKDSSLNVFIIYDGVWQQGGVKWIYEGGSSRVVSLSMSVSYSQLLDKLFEILKVDRALFDFKLEVVYPCGGQPLPPIVVANDADVSIFINENSISIQHRTPLCVTPIRKNISVGHTPSNIMEDRSQVHSFVPETGPTQEPFVDDEPFVNDDHVADLNAYFEEASSDDNFQNVSREKLNIVHAQQVEEECEEPEPQTEKQKQLKKSKIGGSQSSRVNALEANDDDNRWRAFTAEDIANLNGINTSSSASYGALKLGQIFENKLELKTKAHLYAMKKNFEFVVKKSGTDVWYITCKDSNCRWRLRGKKLVSSAMFEIVVFLNEHTCSLEFRHKDNRQAAPWVIGHVIKKKYVIDGSNYSPVNIMNDIKQKYGIKISYEKAWRCREKALMYVRGTPETSYAKLPAFLYMLQQKNPGTIHDFVIEEGVFKYCFLSLGACRRGFSSCRPVLCLDGISLKTKYGGHMLCAVALDANNNLYPIAFAIIDNENHDSWTYFMRKLKEAIGEVENLVFVSYRHASITHALEHVFPNAHHGVCYYYMSMNVTSEFKTDHCHQEMYLAAYAFYKAEFHHYFEKIKVKDPAIASYLEGIGFERWSRAYFPRSRYSVMTSNYAESFNNKTGDAMTWPITTFVEYIRFTLQNWFSDQRETAMKNTSQLAPTLEQDIHKLAERAKYLVVDALSEYEFHVLDGDGDGEVNLLTKECSCGKFQIIGVPCVHALAAALKQNVNMYLLCSKFYTIDALRNSYAEDIYPCGDEVDWNVPESIKDMHVKVPVEKAFVGSPKKKKGRPKKKCKRPQGEHLMLERKCSQCGGRGHNKASCKAKWKR
ncbi:uncharacterized protein LOC133817606 [Humulus lupulus]|uniref:uncharacterized protein LOC133817606 n=1 Tax=Humulus lupulus TaxID=3486 RepID=UPI002B41499D|nr:uncharacterized protein LOC133817606 [Humulus lupulus]